MDAHTVGLEHGGGQATPSTAPLALTDGELSLGLEYGIARLSLDDDAPETLDLQADGPGTGSTQSPSRPGSGLSPRRGLLSRSGRRGGPATPVSVDDGIDFPADPFAPAAGDTLSGTALSERSDGAGFFRAGIPLASSASPAGSAWSRGSLTATAQAGTPGSTEGLPPLPDAPRAEMGPVSAPLGIAFSTGWARGRGRVAQPRTASATAGMASAAGLGHAGGHGSHGPEVLAWFAASMERGPPSLASGGLPPPEAGGPTAYHGAPPEWAASAFPGEALVPRGWPQQPPSSGYGPEAAGPRRDFPGPEAGGPRRELSGPDAGRPSFPAHFTPGPQLGHQYAVLGHEFAQRWRGPPRPFPHSGPAAAQALDARTPNPRKLFVGGLGLDTTDDDLVRHFSAFGRVASAVVMRNKVTAAPRGFGFVVFVEAAAAAACLASTHVVRGRPIDVSPAYPKQAAAPMAASPALPMPPSYGYDPGRHMVHLRPGPLPAPRGPPPAPPMPSSRGTAEQPQSRPPVLAATQPRAGPTGTHGPPPVRLDRGLCRIFVGGMGQALGEAELFRHFRAYGDVVDCEVMRDRANGRSRGFGFVTFASPAAAATAALSRSQAIDGVRVDVSFAHPREVGRARMQQMSPDEAARSAAAAEGAGHPHALDRAHAPAPLAPPPPACETPAPAIPGWS